ncbi:MAG: rpsA [Neobacillus sp.]|nr:rpsA [Neobacillus sp.]
MTTNLFMQEVTKEDLVSPIFLPQVQNQTQFIESEQMNGLKELVGNGKVYKVKIQAVGADRSLRVQLNDDVLGIIPLSEVYKKDLAIKDLKRFIDREVGVTVTDVAPGSIVYLSMIEAREIMRKAYIEKLKEGDVVTAVVTNVDKKTLKVYVDIDGCGLRGYIPIREWDYQFIYDPLKKIGKGTLAQIKIKKIYTNPEVDKTFAFRGSRKELMKNPWIGIEKRFPVGTKVEAVATDLQAVQGRFYATSPLFNGLEILCEYPDNSKIAAIENLSAEDAMVEPPIKEKIIIQLGETYLIRVQRAVEREEKFIGKVLKHIPKSTEIVNK